MIDTLDDINNNITDEFYDGNVPLFDDVMAKKEAKRLRLKVEETHSMLPHGHPDIMSWFDEAEWTHDQINQTADYLIGVLENITDHVELIANQTQVSFQTIAYDILNLHLVACGAAICKSFLAIKRKDRGC